MSVHVPIPEHVAVIMDGNGRWAKAKGLPRVAGHRAAVSRVRALIDACLIHQVGTLTLYAFSSENWLRPQAEVGVLMGLYLHYFKTEVQRWHRKGLKVRILGDTTRLSPTLQAVTQEAECLTARNTRLHFNVAISYGGRFEILQAVKALIKQIQQGCLAVEDLSEAVIESALYTHGQVMPDLMIRTSGVQRISNFLLWQLAYTELYFTPVLFPDFDEKQFEAALAWFAKQPRRFGKIDEQIHTNIG